MTNDSSFVGSSTEEVAHTGIVAVRCDAQSWKILGEAFLGPKEARFFLQSCLVCSNELSFQILEKARSRRFVLLINIGSGQPGSLWMPLEAMNKHNTVLVLSDPSVILEGAEHQACALVPSSGKADSSMMRSGTYSAATGSVPKDIIRRPLPPFAELAFCTKWQTACSCVSHFVKCGWNGTNRTSVG